MKDVAVDVLWFAGAGLVAYGLHLIYHPLAWLVLGGACVFVACTLDSGKKGRKR